MVGQMVVGHFLLAIVDSRVKSAACSLEEILRVQKMCVSVCVSVQREKV